MGAARHTLIMQYLGESMLMSFLSLMISVLMVDLLLPQFNIITGKQLTLHFDIAMIIALICITLFTGFVSGSYPSLYLSRFNPAAVLKNKIATGVGEVWARKGLVVFQFAISILLVVAVWVVYQQMKYIQSTDLGYQRDHIVYFDTEKVSDGLMAELKNIPGVINAARFYHDLTGGHGGTGDVEWEGKTSDNKTHFSNLEVGYDLVETMGMKMAEGNPFSEDFGSYHQIIFNEAAIKSMGLKDPVGKNIKLWGEEKRIVGVVKDFHFESLYEKVGPAFLFLIPMVPDTPSRLMVRIKNGAETETIKALEVFYRRHNPGLVFDYHFLDEDYQRMYASEQRVAQLSQYFATIAILISCLGLFGLAAFTAERRLKEIGIRKVLGSSEWGIIYLLSFDFTKIVLMASCIALPVSYLITSRWLDNFAYRIPLRWWYFIGSGIIALVIAWITVGSQAFKASRVNPTKCLKEE
jgi:putative ABC transport system permease protein